jgi:uncharacterized membrane protein YqjE
MPDSIGDGHQAVATSRGLALHVLTIAENRLALVTVEMQEERDRILHVCFLALAIAGCGLLAGMAVTAAIVVVGWAWSPLGVLLILAAVYVCSAVVMTWLLASRLRQWHSFAASLDQLRKDRICMAEICA